MGTKKLGRFSQREPQVKEVLNHIHGHHWRERKSDPGQTGLHQKKKGQGNKTYLLGGRGSRKTDCESPENLPAIANNVSRALCPFLPNA